MSSCGCSGYTRSEALRRGLAVPGAGLPSIEPGMPLPAGTGLSRRSLLLRGAGLALAVYGGDKLVPQAFEEGIAEAAAAPNQPVLISIFMSGGADGLNILAPTVNPEYQAMRPNLRLTTEETLPVSGHDWLRWHPKFEHMKALHDAGKVVVAPAIGYSSPNQSHFTSRHFWEVGELSTSADSGWMGRYLDLHGSANNPIQGLSVESQLSPTLATSKVAVAAASSPRDYAWDSQNVWDNRIKTPMYGALSALGAAPSDNPILSQARQAQANAAGLRSQLASIPADGPTYPKTGFAKKLQNVARMLGAGLPMRCVTLNASGGYDTHSNQADTLSLNLWQVGTAIATFQADIEARGLGDRVLIHLWSEFGRRPQENSGGTDHGAAGVSFIIGTRAAGGFLGEHPGVRSLDGQGNLRNTSDFRDVYRALLEQWMGVDSAPIIPGRTGPVPTLVK
jgi:uncharacterized protein (DUF1501 family)